MGVPAVFCLFACLFYLGGGGGGNVEGRGLMMTCLFCT